MRNWASQVSAADSFWRYRIAGPALINAGLSKTLIELLNKLRHIFNLAVFDKVFIGA
jgi:hypothetical protein